MEVFGGSEPASRLVALGGLDAWVEAIPHGDAAAGGDVHYISSCATGRITRLLVADVSGHGAKVAEVARTLRGLMREHVNHLDQRRFVARMNDAFARQSTRGTFATAVIMTYFAPTRDLSICNAGHPPPMLYRAEAGRWSPLDHDVDEPGNIDPVRNVPLGIMGGQMYEQFRVGLQPGDRVLCYTDSLVEACDVDTGEMIGPEGLADILNGMAPATTNDRLVPAILNALQNRVGDGLSDDDVTILLLAPNVASARPNMRDHLRAPFTMLARTLAWRKDGTRRMPMPEFTLANFGGAIVPWLSRFRRR